MLIDFVKNGNLQGVIQALRDEEDINSIDVEQHATALHWAAWYGHTAIAELLISQGANLEAKHYNATNRDSTPLLWAAATGHIDIVRLLLAAGADAEATNTKGSDPLGIAQKNGKIDVARVISDHITQVKYANYSYYFSWIGAIISPPQLVRKVGHLVLDSVGDSLTEATGLPVNSAFNLTIETASFFSGPAGYVVQAIVSNVGHTVVDSVVTNCEITNPYVRCGLKLGTDQLSYAAASKAQNSFDMYHAENLRKKAISASKNENVYYAKDRQGGIHHVAQNVENLKSEGYEILVSKSSEVVNIQNKNSATPPDTQLSDNIENQPNINSFFQITPAAHNNTKDASNQDKIKVYYFSRPLKNMGLVSQSRETARHVGVIFDVPGQGLLQMDFTSSSTKSHIVPIEKYHRQTDSRKGRWSYSVGETNLSFDELQTIAKNWTKKHSYKFNTTNYRCFKSHILY